MSRSDLCKSVSRGQGLHTLETPLQEKSNCPHVLFGHHPALFIPFWALNIHILPGVNFKIFPPLPWMSNFLPWDFLPWDLPFFLSFFSTFLPSHSLSLSIFLHLFDLSTVKPGPDTYEPRNIVLSRTKYSTSSLSTTITMVSEFFFFFLLLLLFF